LLVPEPESGGRNWPARAIDSSFCTMYTGPSKPPAVGDLADVRERAGRSRSSRDRDRGPPGGITKNLQAVLQGRPPPQLQFITDIQCGSAATLRGEMGLLPFASTVGTMSISSPSTTHPWQWHGKWRNGMACWCGSCSPSSSLSPFGRTTHPNHIASCLSTARCPEAVARPADIRGSVSRRTSGRTLSRSERGDHAVAERGPPPGPPRRHSSPVAALFAPAFAARGNQLQ
jgi:hypothetical protein